MLQSTGDTLTILKPSYAAQERDSSGRKPMWLHRHSRRPSAEQVAKRLIVLKYVVGYAITTPPRDMLKQWLENWSESEQTKFAHDAEVRRDEYWGHLRALGLWGALSPQEREFASTTMLTMTHQQHLNGMWRIEAVQVLMWAIGLVTSLPPYDTRANHDLLKMIPSEAIERFVNSARLLPSVEIDQARDLAELWHWRGRTRQLIEEGHTLDPNPKMRAAGLETFDDIVRLTARRCKEEGWFEVIDDDFAAHGKPYRNLPAEQWVEIRSITMERHFALNWLCGYAPNNQWDKTPTDT